LFKGEDLSETLAQVLTKEPDLGKLPFKVRRLLLRCLERDPKKRLRDMGDAADLLDDGPSGNAPSPSQFSWVAAALAWSLPRLRFGDGGARRGRWNVRLCG
jgi:serine/threonine-protein kinase